MNVETESPECVDLQASKKGFIHLDNFDRLKAWTNTSVDPLQRSNTPLFKRADDQTVQPSKSKVMLIHDYEGSYLDYEACQGAIVEQEKYSCEYLQHVEVFVYFSHKLVTIPPPTWTNTCHRNGVKVLGTFIVEPDTPQIERILEQQGGRFWVAERLAQIADIYGFDGWLINIEKPFPVFHWNSSELEVFLRQLRSLMGPDRKVVWYDALITLNVVWYQNALNYLNLPFALAAGAILTNYAWNPAMVKQAKDIAERAGLGTENVYFGIDAWAQNTYGGKYPRRTYPPITGGGTGIGLGVLELAKYGINAGIFAPGWSFEHFKDHHRELEQAIWCGDALSADLCCDCTPIGLHLLVPYQDHPIARYANRSPAGTKSFLHTDFRRAFSEYSEQRTPCKFYAHLGRQSILPTSKIAPLRPADSEDPQSSVGSMIVSLESEPSKCSVSLHLKPEAGVLANETIIAHLCIFDICISDARPIELRMEYQKKNTAKVELSLAINKSRNVPFPASIQEEKASIKTLFMDTASFPLKGIDIVLQGQSQHVQCLAQGFLDIFSLTIQPQCDKELTAAIRNIRLESQKFSDSIDARLQWNVDYQIDETVTDMPISNVTGPFAYFSVSMNGRAMGIAFATEFQPDKADIAAIKTTGSATISIAGFGFNGATIASAEKALAWPQDDEAGWVLVDIDAKIPAFSGQQSAERVT